MNRIDQFIESTLRFLHAGKREPQSDESLSSQGLSPATSGEPQEIVRLLDNAEDYEETVSISPPASQYAEFCRWLDAQERCGRMIRCLDNSLRPCLLPLGHPGGCNPFSSQVSGAENLQKERPANVRNHSAPESRNRVRTPDGKPICPNCEHGEHWYLKKQRRWKCRRCWKQFSVTVNTIFENSRLPLVTWIRAVQIIVNCRKGVSSYELHRFLNVTQPTAWFMLNRISVTP
jgi:transposase-like protein